eukprot:2533829-Prymnesium_polylepis.1
MPFMRAPWAFRCRAVRGLATAAARCSLVPATAEWPQAHGAGGGLVVGWVGLHPPPWWPWLTR